MVNSSYMHLLVLLLLLVVPGIIMVSAQTTDDFLENSEPCNACVGGSLTEDLFFGNMPCPEWFDVATLAGDDDEYCYLHRSAGVKYCGCGDGISQEEIDADFGWGGTCFLCGDANSNSQATGMTKVIPDSPVALTCADLMEMPIIDPDQTCPLLQEKYQRFCECPNINASDQEPACTFCPNGGSPDTTILYPFDNIPSPGPADCAALEELYSVQTAAACPFVRASDRDYFLMDMPAYCQCPSVEPPRICNPLFCPKGTGIPAEQLDLVVDDIGFGITCADNTMLLEMMSNPDNCQVMLDYAPDCCATTAGVFVTEPTQQPPVPSSSAGSSVTGLTGILVALGVVATRYLV